MAPALVRGDDPNAPAKKRRIMMVSMFFDPGTPALNAVNIAKEMVYMICRPYSSESGAQKSAACHI